MSNKKLVVHGEFPGMNQIIDAAKTHFAKYSTMKWDLTNRVKLCALSQKIPRVSTKCAFYFDIYAQNRRLDPDNLSAGIHKVVLDGLVNARVLPNDNWAYCSGGMADRFFIDKKNPRVEVWIEEVSGE